MYFTNINTVAAPIFVEERPVIVRTDPIIRQSVSSAGRKIREEDSGVPPAPDNAVQFSTRSV